MGAKPNTKTLWLYAALGLLMSLFLMLALAPQTQAAAGINDQLSFEGKLVNSNGTNITNGTYNMQFKIYQDGNGCIPTSGCNTDPSTQNGGTLKWTENRLVGGSGGVTLTDGTFQVNLGSVTAFGSSVDWNQDTLWLSMQIGNTSSCTITTTFQSNCSGDGEMISFIRLTAVPYAMNAAKLGGLAASGFIQNSTSAQTANFNIQSGASGSIAAVIQGASGQSVDIAQVKANGVSTPVFAVGSTGNATFRVATGNDSALAFQVQNAAGSNALAVDTTPLNTNLTNPSFENTDVSAWTYLGTPGSVTRSTSEAYIGSASLSVTTTNNASNGVKYVTGNGSQALATGTTYTISWFDKLSSSTLTDIRAVYARDGSTETACRNINTQTLSTTAWTRHSCQIVTDGTSPASTAYIAIEQTAAPGGARTFYVDAVQIQSSGIATFKETGLSLNGVINSPVQLVNQSDSTNAFQIQSSSGTTVLLTDTKNSRVGIGTSAPTQALTIGSQGNIAVDIGVPSAPTLSLQSGGSLSTSSTYYYKIAPTDGSSNGIGTASNESTGLQPTSGNQTIRVTWSLQIGIASYKIYRTTTPGVYPSSSLVATVVSDGSTNIYDDTGGATSAGTPSIVSTAYSTRIAAPASVSSTYFLNSVGIGTAQPGAMLEVTTGGFSPQGVALRAKQGAVSTSDVFQLQANNGTSNCSSGCFIQVTSPAINEGAVTIQSLGGTRDLTLNSGSGTLKLGSATTTLQKAASSFVLDVSNGGSNSTLTVSNTGGAGNITLQLDSGGSFAVGASTGSTLTACGSNQYLASQAVTGGIVTGGTCTNFSAAATTLQDAYNNSSSPATITTASGKGVLIAAGGGADNANLFQVKSSSGNSLFNVDSSNSGISFNDSNNINALKFNMLSVSNVITNPSFELDGNGVTPTGWAKLVGNEQIFLTSDTIGASSQIASHDGAEGLKIQAANSVANEGAKYTSTLTANRTYVFSVWATVGGGGTTFGTFELGYSQDGSTNTSCLTGQSLTTGWQQFSCTFTPTSISGSPYVYVRDTSSTATGHTFYIDTASLQTSNGGSAMVNLIQNPSFENGNVNGWSQRSVTGSTAVTLANSSDTSYFGSQSLKVTTGTGNGNITFYSTPLLSNTQYSLSFWARRDTSSAATFNIGRSEKYANEGTASQSTTTVTGSSTTWLTDGPGGGPVPAGSTIVYANGDTDTITANASSNTSLTVTRSATESGQAYTIYINTDCLTGQTLNTTWIQFNCTFTTGTNTATGTYNGLSSYFYIRQTDTTSENIYIDGVTLIQAATGLSFTPTAQNIEVNSQLDQITLNGSQSGEISPWQNANTVTARRHAATAIANGYIYYIGGLSASPAPLNTVNYTKLNADGSVGTWNTTSNMPGPLYGMAATVANGYLYVVGGCNDASSTAACTSRVSTVYYAPINSDGTIGSWKTNTYSAYSAGYSSVAVANGYLYEMGGYNGGAPLATVQSAKLNPDGSTNSWTVISSLTTGGTAVYGQTSLVANGAIYTIGGCTDSSSGICSTPSGVVQRANTTTAGTFDANSWRSTNSLPTATGLHGSVLLNGNIYIIGGKTTSAAKSVLYSKVNSDGTVGNWNYSAYMLPAARQGASSITGNNYIYTIGGYDGTNVQSNVFQSSGARTLIYGGLDLVGLSGQTLRDPGGAGTLTVGDTTVVGQMQVMGAANFQQGLSITGSLSVGSILGVDTVNSNITTGANLIIGAQTDNSTPIGTNVANIGGVGSAIGFPDGVTAEVVYKGKLFVATTLADSAAVYRYDGGTTWTLVTAAAGKVLSGDTANIDNYAMTVFNGALYIGSQTGSASGQAGLFSSTDATSSTPTWTLVNSARGSFGMSQAAVDGVQDLVVWNGNLYISTLEPQLAEIGRYDGGTTFTQINATDGKIAAEATAATDGVNFVVYEGRLFFGGITSYGTVGTAAAVGVYDGIGTTTTNLNATQGTFGVDASRVDVTSLTVWNGGLYIAASATNGAGIYRWLPDQASGANTTVTNFNLVSGAVGKVSSLDTANIDAVVLKAYNGRLYAGSQTATGEDAANLYEYGGTKGTWTSIAVNGNIGSPFTGINSISALQEYNGTFYIGSSEPLGSGQVTIFTKTAENSYGLEFNSGSNNLAQISFVGNRQTSDNNGHYGTFLFSHSITMGAGAFDYAEDYPTSDPNLVSGEPVTTDPQAPEQVKRASAGDTILGVVSKNPGFRLSASADSQPLPDGALWVPIALVGRVPVKVLVDDATGAISPGNKLSLSKLPGVLHKAKPGEQIVGVALTGYDTTSIGSVSMFVHPEWSESGTSGVVAQLEPIEGLTLQSKSGGTSTLLKLLDSYGNETVSVDHQGNAFFKGTITANKIKANQIEGLEIYTNRLSELEQQVANANVATLANSNGSVESTNGLNMNGLFIKNAIIGIDLNVNGGFSVGGNAQFNGNAFFYRLVTFSEKTLFKNDVSFEGRPTFNNDTAGFALINPTQKEVKVVFDKPYAQPPIVVVSVSDGHFVQYAYKDLDEKGFTIVLPQAATEKINFSWMALSIKDTRTHQVTLPPDVVPTSQ